MLRHTLAALALTTGCASVTSQQISTEATPNRIEQTSPEQTPTRESLSRPAAHKNRSYVDIMRPAHRDPALEGFVDAVNNLVIHTLSTTGYAESYSSLKTCIEDGKKSGYDLDTCFADLIEPRLRQHYQKHAVPEDIQNTVIRRIRTMFENDTSLPKPAPKKPSRVRDHDTVA